MKIPITFKTPDVIYYALKDLGCDAEEDEATIEEFLSKWIKHGELITIEFDTETETAEVVSAR